MLDDFDDLEFDCRGDEGNTNVGNDANECKCRNGESPAERRVRPSGDTEAIFLDSVSVRFLRFVRKGKLFTVVHSCIESRHSLFFNLNQSVKVVGRSVNSNTVVIT